MNGFQAQSAISRLSLRSLGAPLLRVIHIDRPLTVMHSSRHHRNANRARKWSSSVDESRRSSSHDDSYRLVPSRACILLNVRNRSFRRTARVVEKRSTDANLLELSNVVLARDTSPLTGSRSLCVRDRGSARNRVDAPCSDGDRLMGSESRARYCRPQAFLRHGDRRLHNDR